MRKPLNELFEEAILDFLKKHARTVGSKARKSLGDLSKQEKQIMIEQITRKLLEEMESYSGVRGKRRKAQ
jgi:hypothetical protein